jgi:hypothetical protein
MPTSISPRSDEYGTMPDLNDQTIYGGILSSETAYGESSIFSQME